MNERSSPADPAPPAYPTTFWALVEQCAARDADRVLLEDEAGRSLRAGELAARAERAAAGLHALGVGPGPAVSWQHPPILESAVLLCALARLGAVQNPIIPILRRREVGFIAAETRAELLITPSVWRNFDYAAMAEDIVAELGCAHLVVDRDALPDGDPATLPPPPTGEGDPTRFVYYSSGTTADPKGGRHSDASAMAGANGVLVNLGVTGDDCVPVPFPFTHIGGIAYATAMLCTGCRLVFLEAFDPQRSPLVMAEHGATLLGSAVPFFHAYMAAQRAHGPAPLFTRLRAFSSGGAPKPPEIHYELKELFGAGTISGYGLTEFPIATSSCVDDTDEELANTEGRAAPGVQIRVVGSDGRDLAAGEDGELRLKGPQMIKGYVDGGLDAAAFDEQGFFRTGDLGVVGPRGHVRVSGRLKDVIIRNAENISAQEVEGVLYAHPKIADVAVIGLPDPKTGERACAVVVLADGVAALSLGDVAEHCRAQQLAVQKIPERLEIVAALPRNSMGKILKQALRDHYRA
jgi:acyl-CoA synthetase (AMP-forming)/AMP-acid ligase II